MPRRHDPDHLAKAYLRVRSLSEALAAPLQPEDTCIQSMPDVSPTKWHLAHTSWFFETFVLDGAGYARFRPGYEVLFNSYYQTVGPMHPRPQRGMLSRPTLAEVIEYRHAIDARMLEALPKLDEPARRLVELGLHHEQQHQELILTDIKHVLAQNPLAPAYRGRSKSPRHREAPALRWVEDPGGLVSIGRDLEAPGAEFGFDNEGPRHQQWLEPFALASRPATCEEYLAFIQDGGYTRPELWLSDGWEAVRQQGWTAPAYWQREGDEWQVFGLDGLHPLDLAAPVCHSSYYEADAFARWSGARLPSEAEWEQIARSIDIAGNLLPTTREQLEHAPLAPTPSDDEADSSGLAQLFGDVWEWTASPYVPYPGYRPPPGAVGEYNGKFMCNQIILRGGSCATPADHIRPGYRNFFPAGARWQFSGIRLARDLSAIALAVVLSAGCERPQPDASKTQDTKAKPSESGPYAGYEFPPIMDDWDSKEYSKVRDTLLAIDREKPELLVTLDGPKGDVFARVASTKHIDTAIRKAGDMNRMYLVAEAVLAIYKIYVDRVYKGQPYGKEFLLLTKTILRSATAQFERLASAGGEGKLQDDPDLRDRLVELRRGMVTVYIGALTAPLELAAVDATTAAIELDAAAEDVAPFLLPDERQVVDQLLLALVGVGADASRVAAARRSVAKAQMHPILATFIDLAQAHAEKNRQNTVLEQRSPGSTFDAFRYEFPDAGFSAVFQQQPKALLTKSAVSGESITTRMLGMRDESGHATSIMCISVPPADDSRSFARATIQAGTDLREIEIDGRKGFEAKFSSSISSGIMRTVDLERAGCLIFVESPADLADRYAKQARAFLESVDFGDFQG